MKRKMSLLGIVCTVLFVVTCINPESNPDINPDATGIVADEYEPDDSRSTAKLIYPDSSSQSRTLKMGETDWVRLEALSGKSYEIITDGKIDTKLEVYSATGSEPVVGGDDSPGDINAVVTLNATSDGVYYIAVFGHDDSTLGSYELRVVSSIGPDAFEPDSLPNPARSITAGATQKRSLTEGDVDWVICRLAADDTVLLTAEGTCPIALTLYDRDTVTELESPSAGDSMTQISHHAEKAGNYFLKVTADDPDDTGSYELTMQSSSSGSLIAADDFEDDDTRSSAELVPGNSFIQQRTLTFNDTDWVCLPVVEGRQYNVTFTNTSFLKATMLSNDGMELQGPASSLYLNSSADDTVYIQIYSTDSIAFRYSLTITVLLQPNIADDYEDDNSKELAKENCVPVDSFIQDRTLTVKNSVSDTDWVAFPVVAAKQYLFKVTTSSSTTLYMYLYDNTSSSYIRNTSGSSPSISYTPPVSDTMYLRIYRPSSSTGVAYTLSVRGELKNDSFEPDSSRSTARSITTTSQSRILLPDDTDWVAYTAAADDSIAIVTTGATDTKIALFSSSGSTPIEENDDIDDDNTNAMISWKSASGGQFYIRVTGKTSSTSGSYVLQVLSVLNGTLTAADSFEVDNTKDEARIIPDTIVSGEVHSLTLNDTDWVAFPVLAGGQYTVSVSSSSNYLNVHAYTSSDSLFYSRTSATSASIPYTAKKNDTLYYRVTSASVVQRYTVSMSRIAPPPHDEYENDNTKEAARILFDTIVSSEVHSMPLYDTDWVAFPALAGGQYTVSVSSSSSALSVYAYTSKDSLFTSRTNYTSTSITRISPIDDTLYYRITSNYSLQRYTVSMSMIAPPSPDQYEDDDTKDEARIVLDTILSGEVHSLPLTD
ncbi:MAG: hypothetical protein JW913_15580, partial [Chitinispirillaceae bacterium]|nr:hypothetical protein [Chitinispirillaceae bacterium]